MGEGGWEKAKDASSIFRGLIAHLKEDNLEGVHIYPAPEGGWHGDVTFRNLPPGIPSVVGTPVAMPCNTRDEAIQHAVGNISMLLTLIEDQSILGDYPNNLAAFQLDEETIFVPIDYLEELQKPFKEIMSTSKSRIDMEAHTLRRLQQVSLKYGGHDGLKQRVMSNLSDDERKELIIVAATALMLKIPRWPIPEDSPPSGERTNN